MSYTHFEIEKRGSSAIAYLGSPRRNVVNWSFYQELPVLLRDLENGEELKSVILIGSGKNFSAGLELEDFLGSDHAFRERSAEDRRQQLFQLSLNRTAALNALASSRLVTVAALHGHVIGGGLDLAIAARRRLATRDAFFTYRDMEGFLFQKFLNAEVAAGIASRENFSAMDAHALGFVESLYDTKEQLIDAALVI